MTYLRSFIVLLFFTLVLVSCTQRDHTVQKHEGLSVGAWPEIKKEHKPWTRWWWMGSAVDEPNIAHLLEQYADAGIGGVEIAPIYGAKDYEDRYIDFLSPEWIEMLRFTIEKADALDMGVDMTLGTGWPFGGPQVTPEYAASKLIVQNYTLEGGQQLQEKLRINDPKQAEASLQAVMAFNSQGETIDITGMVNPEGELNWSPEHGKWEIYAAYIGKTKQMVKRAAPGGEGYTLDHFSKAAVDAYLNRFDKVFKDDNLEVRAFYNDSYEVYGANWSADFFQEFENIKGYDLRDYLNVFSSKDNSLQVSRLMSDYREAMSAMLLENFTERWTSWAHGHKSITKNQAHGSPGNLLDLYAAVDIPECETFGSSYFPIPGLRRDSADVRNVDPDPIMLKFASSGAHAAGNNLVSCETFTWLGEHFKTSFSQCKPEVEQVFLSGVNHVFYHGITYSPQDVPWPGWLFYASLNLTPANSLWPHFEGLNNYIARCQSILQSGVPDNELAVYWPVYDVWSKSEGMEMLIKVHDIDEWLHPTSFYKQTKNLMDVGYSLDFVSDKMLQEAIVDNGNLKMSKNAAEHKVLVIPGAEFMPLSTLERVISLAKEGATVVMEQLPSDVPGLYRLEERRSEFKQLLASLTFEDVGKDVRQMKIGKGAILLAENIQQALEFKKVYRETLTDTGLKFIRRKTDSGKYYYLVNHRDKAVETILPLNSMAKEVIVMDPQSGHIGKADFSSEGSITHVRVQMNPGESLILHVSTEQNPSISRWTYLDKSEAPIRINGPWTLRFTDGGPALPSDHQLSDLVSWTSLSPEAEAFSGTGEYFATFDLLEKEADEYLLDLGKVSESARVWVNGEPIGLLWSIPFQARIGQYLKPGENTIKIEVANLMANRIRYMDQQGMEWRRYHEINFVNIDYKPFDASVWKPMPSGLLGPVTITPHSLSK